MTATMATRLPDVTDQQGHSDEQGQMFPQRRPTHRPPSLRPGGRHRRDIPVSLSQDAPALVIAVPGIGTELTSGPVGELMTILRVDNPAVDVRAALIDATPDDPESVGSVLTAIAANRDDDSTGPCAVVIP